MRISLYNGAMKLINAWTNRLGPFSRVWLAVALALGFLWFPFDWLSKVWPAFGVPFHVLFHDARGHFIGHTIFFLVIGLFMQALLPVLQRKPLMYFVGLVLAALIQETIQAFFRGVIPRFDDYNAFRGDAIGGASAFVVFFVVNLKRNRQ